MHQRTGPMTRAGAGRRAFPGRCPGRVVAADVDARRRRRSAPGSSGTPGTARLGAGGKKSNWRARRGDRSREERREPRTRVPTGRPPRHPPPRLLDHAAHRLRTSSLSRNGLCEHPVLRPGPAPLAPLVKEDAGGGLDLEQLARTSPAMPIGGTSPDGRRRRGRSPARRSPHEAWLQARITRGLVVDRHEATPLRCRDLRPAARWRRRSARLAVDLDHPGGPAMPTRPISLVLRGRTRGQLLVRAAAMSRRPRRRRRSSAPAPLWRRLAFANAVRTASPCRRRRQQSARRRPITWRKNWSKSSRVAASAGRRPAAWLRAALRRSPR